MDGWYASIFGWEFGGGGNGRGKGSRQRRPFSIRKEKKMFIPKVIISVLIPFFYIFNPFDAAEPGGKTRIQTIHSTVNTRPGNLTVECSKPLDLGPKYEALFVMKINTTSGFKVCLIIVYNIISIFLLKDITNCTYADCLTYHWDRAIILKMPVYSDQVFNCSIYISDEECRANRHIHGLSCPLDIIDHIIHVKIQQE